jgi:alpha-glucosidase
MPRLILLLALLWPGLAWAQTLPPAPSPVSAQSPGNVLCFSIGASAEGRITYSIDRLGKPVIAPSEMGFLFTDQPELLRNFKLVSSVVSDHDDSWTQPWGEYRNIRNHYRELDATFEESNGSHRRLTIEVRLFDDAVGFRYRFDRPAGETTNIAEELTRFTLAEDGKAWWAPAFEWNREEYLYENTPISGIGTGQTPLTMVLDDGTHVSIHEAALVDYSGMNLARAMGTTLKSVLTPSSTGPKVSRTGSFTTPWRLVMIAPDAPALYAAAKEELNLNEPNRLGDVSWFKPMTYAGIWWAMHLDQKTWNSGLRHGATTAEAKKIIDFAARNGLGGVLIEGWNVGWDGDWFGNGSDFSFTKAYPDFDLPAVAAYARSKGVQLIGHNETAGNIANYEAQLDAALDQDQRLGIHAVKTGYVADAGGIRALGADGKIHFEWHEGQAAVRHHLKVVTEAAKRQVAIDPHEPIKDTGLRRTYPNWVAREGERGQEYNAWGVPKNPPKWESEIFFGRMLGGPFDFTPGVVSLKGKGDTDILSTLAKQLALYIVIYSPIQMAADLPENYAREPVAFDFIKKVAVDWDDTRVLSGEIGRWVVVARKERDRSNWYVGAVSNEQPRGVTVPLAFLDPGRRYTAEIWRDGPTAEFGAKGHDMIHETRAVGASDALNLHIAAGGGFAIRISPAR